LLGLASQRFDELADRLPRGLQNVSQQKSIQLNRLLGGLSASRLKQMVAFRESQLATSGARLAPAYDRKLADLSNRLEATSRMLDSLSYERVLDRGFALVEGADGLPVSKSAGLVAGDQLTVRFADGKTSVEVVDDQSTKPKQAKPQKPKKASPKKTKIDDGRQGSLL
ncbi:MAG: exodeoxyribonuclease VII large subunit, partial [Kordiimonas sp.]